MVCLTVYQSLDLLVTGKEEWILWNRLKGNGVD